MSQETNNDGGHILDQITIPARPPEFFRTDIEEAYRQGLFHSRLEAELADILHSCTSDSGLEEQPITLTVQNLDQVKTLHCLALIQDGEILPLVDIATIATPTTSAEKVEIFTLLAHKLFGAIVIVLDDLFTTREDHQDDTNDEGGACHVR